MTTCEPGASEVFTQGLGFSPLARALRARRPAASMTEGLEVLVQLVIAAITTSPWPRSCERPSTGKRSSSRPALPKSLERAWAKARAAFDSATRSCGRFGPASDGSTVERSSVRVSVNSGSSALSSLQRPWALA